MSEAPGLETFSPAGLPHRKMEDNAPVNVDAILQAILGRGKERFGMAAAVLRGERIIAHGVAGVRKRGTAERITLDDRFHLGSCTKAMTATLVAMLVEEGKVNWTTRRNLPCRMVYQHSQLGKRHPAWRHRPPPLARRKQRKVELRRGHRTRN
jgi:hypothetical protein